MNLILLSSLVCLGSWLALLDLRVMRGHHPSHAYLYYAAAVLAVAVTLALASQQPLYAAGWAATGLAACGGCLLMLGNLSMQRALLMKVSLSIVLPISRIPTDVRSTSLIGEVRSASAAWAP